MQIAIDQNRAAGDEARRERDDHLRFDEVWGVFDIDEHPNLPEVRELAAENGIELAISNPRFEL